MKRIFENTGQPWTGMCAAWDWLDANGYACGGFRSDSPMGILRGEANIPRWDMLTKLDCSRFHGTVTAIDDLYEKRGAIVEIRDEFAPKDEE